MLASPGIIEYTNQVTFWRAIGLISGTSMDGIDVAAADLRFSTEARGQGEGVVELRPLGYTEIHYPQRLRQRLLEALPPGTCDAREFCMLDTEVGQSFAEAAHYGVTSLGTGTADLVSSLGQTIYHWVEDGQALGTLQLGQPAWIAERTGLPVISDLRARDIAAGGHGAPLAAIIDTLWLADEPGVGIALNIGGIANITVVGGDRPFAYDTGPGNALIDAAMYLTSDGRVAQDTGGELAAHGTVRSDLLERLLADPYYQREAPKSTGKEHFNSEYLQPLLAEADTADLVATLTELTAVTITDACRTHRATRVIVSGGGAANPTLMRRLRELLAADNITLAVSDEQGLPSGGKEAYLTALLGFLTSHGLAGNIPGATGATGPRMLGSITPGQVPWQPPAPVTTPVRRLHVHQPSASA